MLIATTTGSSADLQQIIALQKENLKQHISEEEKNEQGFLTMEFNLPMLQELQRIAPSVIIKDNDQVVAYAMVLMQAGRQVYPALEPMFRNFETLSWQGKPLYDYHFYTMGQICIAKSHRAKGLFKMLYNEHRTIYSQQFDFIITEISTANVRSLNAHHRLGFETINRFRDDMDEWEVVLWDWK